MFLPSVLECSEQVVEKKLEMVIEKIETVYSLLKIQKDIPLPFHLDFVLPQFAKDRSVMKSLSPETILGILEKFFSSQRLSLTIHLMGNVQDIFESYKFFNDYSFNPNWQYLIFVDSNYFKSWVNSSFANLNLDNLDLGIWYDKGEWENLESFNLNQELEIDCQNYLLMTVLAGKSGQKLTPQIKDLALQKTIQNPNKKFILDGGWSVEEEENISQNTEIVSYTSFWNQISM